MFNKVYCLIKKLNIIYLSGNFLIKSTAFQLFYYVYNIFLHFLRNNNFVFYVH